MGTTRRLNLVWLAALGLGLAAPVRAGEIAVAALRVEDLVQPLGLDEPVPRFSWRILDERRGAAQTAYRLQVGSAPGRADVWDSGVVASSRSVHVPYGGPPLAPRRRYYWRVRVWDAWGEPADFSRPAFWETGLLDPAGWRAQWIGISANAALVRRSFVLHQPVQRARVYVTARGLYRLHLNGQAVGRAAFAPEWTDYRVRSVYQTYDVTPLLQVGENVVGAWLGKGWYGSKLDWKSLPPYVYGPPPMRLLLQMHLVLADGSERVVVSDGTWKGTPGPIVEATLYGGETYDARLEQPGWDAPGFDARAWSAVTTATFAVRLTGQAVQPITVAESRRPVSVARPSGGVHVFDLGQNMVGWVRLRVQGPRGTRVRLRFAEMVKPDGNIDTYNLRTARQTDDYTLKGDPAGEVFEPRFTYHGFRYVEVTGYPGSPGLDDVTGRVLHTAAPVTGSFSCSSALVDRLWRAALWTQRGNWFSVPTGAPQRDERMAWLGDAHAFWGTACYNMELAAFSRKWMRDVVEAQVSTGSFRDISPDVPRLLRAEAAPFWGDAGISVPWTAYRHYGDTRVIQASYPAMQRWMNYILGGNPGYLWTNRVGSNWGDWLAPSGNPSSDKPVIATAVWAQDAKRMAEMARAIGRPAEAAAYDQLYTNIRAAFIKNYVQSDGRVGSGHQTPQVMALRTGLVPPDRVQAAVTRLVGDIVGRGVHLSTGFCGVSYLLPALSDAGRDDVAYGLLLQTTYPSWLYMIQQGGTTIWERWNNDVVFRQRQSNMCSFNHFCFGCVAEWLYRYAAGLDVDPAGPGFRRLVLRPHIAAGLTWVAAEYESAYGPIRSRWATRNGDLALDVTVPPSTSATVYVPTPNPRIIRESGRHVLPGGEITFLGRRGNAAVFEIPAGAYAFTVGGLTTEGVPRPGAQVLIHLTRPARAGDGYQMAMALSNRRGIPVPGLGVIPLDPDTLFLLSVANLLPGVFQGFRGHLDPAGEASATFGVPAVPALVGLTFYLGAVTYDTRGLTYIANGTKLTFVE